MKKIYLTILIVTLHISAFPQKIKFGKIAVEELKEHTYEKDTLADAVYLYKSTRTYFDFTNGLNAITKVHNRIKIYNDDAFDLATHEIALYSPGNNSDSERVTSLKATTYNLVDGKIIKHKLSKKSVFKEQKNKYTQTTSFTMPEVEKGCIIEYSYTITSPRLDLKNLDFQFDIPIKRFHARTEVPEYFTFRKKVKGYYSISPKIEKQSVTNELGLYTNTITTYDDTDIPSLKDNEPYISNIKNYRGGVQFELESIVIPGSLYKDYSNSWESVSTTIFESHDFGQQLKYSNYFEKDLETILKDQTSYGQKLVTILEFVKTKIRWNGYVGKYTNKGVRKAYSDGTGNIAEINLTLVAMLRKAGFTANPVLLSTRDHGIPFFPTLDGFNYVIVAVHSEKSGYLLLDASEPYSSPNNLPLRDLNWNGRMIAANGRSTSINLSSRKLSEENNNLSITIDDEFHIKGLLRRKLDGLQAFSYRTNNNKYKDDEIIEKLENKYNVEISNFRISNKQTPYKPVSQMIQFESDDLLEVINGKIYIDPLLFFTTKINPFKSEDRKFPVDYGTPWKEKNQISINIPEGYKIESIPETFGIGLPEDIGVFKFLINSNNNSISIRSEEVINTSIISPKYYKDLKAFYNEVVLKQKEKIILSKI